MCKQYFQPFFVSFLGRKIEKLAFHYFKPYMNTKWKAYFFLFRVPKMPKNSWKYLLHWYKFMDYNEVWFPRSTFHKKSPGVLFSQCRSKTSNWAKINIFYTFSPVIIISWICSKTILHNLVHFVKLLLFCVCILGLRILCVPHLKQPLMGKAPQWMHLSSCLQETSLLMTRFLWFCLHNLISLRIPSVETRCSRGCCTYSSIFSNKWFTDCLKCSNA